MSHKTIYAFISYSGKDQSVAGKMKNFLTDSYGIEAFLAHEDIEGGSHRRNKIIEEIGKADAFVTLLSQDFIQSQYCLQESGIAEFRKMERIHFSLDKTLPPGFCDSSIQTHRINSDSFNKLDILNPIHNYAADIAFNFILQEVKEINSYRYSNDFFKNQNVTKYVEKIFRAPERLKDFLKSCSDNNQIVYDERDSFRAILNKNTTHENQEIVQQYFP